MLELCLSATMLSSATSFLALNHQQHHDDTPSASGGRQKHVGGVTRGVRVEQLGSWAERRLAVGWPAGRGTLG